MFPKITRSGISFRVFLLIAGSVITSVIPTIATDISTQDFNFNLSDITANQSYMDIAKLLSDFKNVSGTYDNPDFGFTIVFPAGWNGMEISSEFGKFATVSAPDAQSDTHNPSVMGVMFIDNRNNTALSFVSNATNLIADPTSSDIGGVSQKPECKSTSVSQVTINGINGEERKITCTNMMGLGGNANIKGYTFVTNDDSLLTVSFISPQDTYDKNLPKFDESVKTIKILNPGDLSNSATYNAYKNALRSDCQNKHAIDLIASTQGKVDFLSARMITPSFFRSR